MNDRFDLHIITQPHSEVYCGYFRRLVFVNSLTFSHITPCFHAKPPNFLCLFDPHVGYAKRTSQAIVSNKSVHIFIIISDWSDILTNDME